MAAQTTLQDLLQTSSYELDFLSEAAQALVAARQALRWSWPHAFFHTQAIAEGLKKMKDSAAAAAAGAAAAAASSSDESDDREGYGIEGRRKKQRVSASDVIHVAAGPGGVDILDQGGVAGEAGVDVVGVVAAGRGAPGRGVPHVELSPVAAASPPPLLEAMASQHPELRKPLHALRLFETRQGHLEGFCETLSGLLDIKRIENGAIANLRTCSASVRAAFVLGEMLRGGKRIGDGPREVAEADLSRFEGGLPALRSKLSLFTSGVIRSLEALAVDDAELLGDE
jgi:hypothetical protein